MLANVEQVVLGKTDQLQLVLAAFACGATSSSRTSRGRPRRCSRARSRGSTRARGRRGSSARPTCSRPTSRASRSTTSATRDFEFRPGPVFANVAARRRDQPRDAEDAVGAARGDGGAPGDRRRRDAAAPRAVPRCSRRRTRSSTRARSRCPRRSSTASSSAPRSAIPTRTRSSRSSLDQRHGHPLETAPPGRVARGRRALQRARRGRLRRPARSSAGSSTSCARRASSRSSSSAPRCAAPLARAGGARERARSQGRTTSCPADIVRLFPPVARPPRRPRRRDARADDRGPSSSRGSCAAASSGPRGRSPAGAA